jgi:protein TonB
MFEGSLVESRGLVRSGARKWTALGSLTVQLAAVGVVLLIPLLRPAALPFVSAPPLAVPFRVKPPEPVPVRVSEAAASASAMSMPTVAVPVAESHGRFVFPQGEPAEGPAPGIDPNLHMGDGGTGMISLVGPLGPATAVMPVRARDVGPAKVSKGVLDGMLLAPIRPVYPAIAKAAGVQGTVVLEAVISKTGRIESLHVVSGHPMLRNAAVEAVQAARYRPYKLNDEAVDVQTTITVVFELGASY